MIRKIILVNIFIFLLMLFAIEGSSRILITKQQDAKALFSDEGLRIRGRSFVQKDQTRGFSLVPGFKNSLYHINKQGFRGNEFPKDFNSIYRVLTLGESTTFGWDVNEEETYPYYLMKKIKEKNSKLYVINGGVPSYTSSQVLLYMQEIFAKNEIKPHLILVNIMWNDIWYSTVKNWHSNILVHQKPPSWLNFLTRHSYFFYGLVMGFETQKKENDLFNQEAYQYYLSNLESMIKLAHKHGSKIVFVEPPFDADHMPEEGLKEFQIRYSKPFLIETAQKYHTSMQTLGKKYNVPVLTHRLGLKNIHQKSLFLDALHPTAEGNEMMADDISMKLSLP